MLASGTQVRGVQTRPKPLDFSGEKFLSMPSFGGESKAVCPISQFCGMLKKPTITVEVAIVG
jgi:hypothetical protein